MKQYFSRIAKIEGMYERGSDDVKPLRPVSEGPGRGAAAEPPRRVRAGFRRFPSAGSGRRARPFPVRRKML